jgi:enoyl-CoA hydratase/carnithine racemase
MSRTPDRASPPDLIELRLDGQIAYVAFNRPEVLNAVSTAMHLQLIEVFDDIAIHPEVRCVIIKGNGRAFCVGADYKERQDMDLQDIRRRRRVSPAAFGAMRKCTRPVIAAVHGYALGSGLEMALNCDLIVAAEGTEFALLETARGAIPVGGGTQILPRLVGVLRARELIFTGRRFTAEQAMEWGMLNYVVALDQLEDCVHRIAEQICTAAPVSVIQAKEAINISVETSLSAGLRMETALFERTLTTSDRLEAIAAYRECRKPVFKGE